MAYERVKLKNQLQLILNYGEFEGKIKKKTKSYLDLGLDEAIVTPEAVVLTGKAIGKLITPIVTDSNNIMTYQNIERA
ncbi:hypothetical protein ACH52_0336 [Eubacterium limosum]|nr:hypothetical protein ACH52_0336 [Eubacterium limosum]